MAWVNEGEDGLSGVEGGDPAGGAARRIARSGRQTGNGIMGMEREDPRILGIGGFIVYRGVIQNRRKTR